MEAGQTGDRFEMQQAMQAAKQVNLKDLLACENINDSNVFSR